MEKIKELIMLAKTHYIEYIRIKIGDRGASTSQQEAMLNELLQLCDHELDFESVVNRLNDFIVRHNITGTKLEPFLGVMIKYLHVRQNPDTLARVLLDIDDILLTLREDEQDSFNDSPSFLSPGRKGLSSHLSPFVASVKKDLMDLKTAASVHHENARQRDLLRDAVAVADENQRLRKQLEENSHTIEALETLVVKQHEARTLSDEQESSKLPYGDTGFFIHRDHVGLIDESYYAKLIELIANDQKYDRLFSESKAKMVESLRVLRETEVNRSHEPNIAPYMKKVMDEVENIYERLVSIYHRIYRLEIPLLDIYEWEQWKVYLKNTLLPQCEGLLARLNRYSADHQKTKVQLENLVPILMEQEDKLGLDCLGKVYSRTTLIHDFYMGLLTFGRASIERIESAIDPKRAYGQHTTLEYFTAFRNTGALNYDACLLKIADNERKIEEYAQKAAKRASQLRASMELSSTDGSASSRAGSSEPSEPSEHSDESFFVGVTAGASDK